MLFFRCSREGGTAEENLIVCCIVEYYRVIFLTGPTLKITSMENIATIANAVTITLNSKVTM